MLKAILGATLLVPAAALAQNSPPSVSDVKQDSPNNDPGQVVCRVERELGSRLNRTRVCRTRAEWAEHVRQTRDRVDRAQQQRQDQY